MWSHQKNLASKMRNPSLYYLRPFWQALLMPLLTMNMALADEKPKASADDATHGYHAFGFAELSVAASLRQHTYKKYSKSLKGAMKLRAGIAELLDNPSQDTLNKARQLWISARVPYSKSEVLRFVFPEVDQWEGSVNAWPVDEGFIDYVALDSEPSKDNPYSTLNIVANSMIKINGEKADFSRITPQLLSSTLHELDGIESNVATGYHAIEFLLWGQDVGNGGNRPWTDFSQEACSNGNCDRRRDYLLSAADLLVTDLKSMLNRWERDGDLTLKLITGEPQLIMGKILEGIVEFIQAELAGERMKLALSLHAPEEEHDCFSDNTHMSLWNNFKGIEKIFYGLPNMPQNIEFAEMLPNRDTVRKAHTEARVALKAIVKRASHGEPFDKLVLESNPDGNDVVQNAINKLSLLSLALIESRSHYK
jgi:putative iron-regulated protein